MKFVKNRSLSFVVILALILRLGFFFAAQPWTKHMQNTRIVRSDVIGYDALAQSLLHGKFEINGIKNTFRTPGYPAFIALVYAIFGHKPHVVLLVQILINILTILLLYQATSVLLGNKAALWASLLLAIDPITVLYNLELFTETLFVFSLVLGFYVYILGLKKHRPVLLLLAAFVFGLAALIKPIAQYIFVVLIIPVAWDKFFPYLQKIRLVLSVIIVFSLMLLPWMYRNYKSFGKFELCSLPKYNLVFYNLAFTEHDRTSEPVNKIRRRLTEDVRLRGGIISHWDATNAKQFDNEHIYSAMIKEYLRKHFPFFLYTHLKNSFYVYLNVGTKGFLSMLHVPEREIPQMAAQGLRQNIRAIFKYKTKLELVLIFSFAAFLGAVYLLALTGAVTLLRQKRYFEFILILLFVAYFTFLLGANGNSARYRLPITPFYSMLAAVGLQKVMKKIQEKRA